MPGVMTEVAATLAGKERPARAKKHWLCSSIRRQRGCVPPNSSQDRPVSSFTLAQKTEKAISVSHSQGQFGRKDANSKWEQVMIWRSSRMNWRPLNVNILFCYLKIILHHRKRVVLHISTSLRCLHSAWLKSQSPGADRTCSPRVFGQRPSRNFHNACARARCRGAVRWHQEGG